MRTLTLNPQEFQEKHVPRTSLDQYYSTLEDKVKPHEDLRQGKLVVPTDNSSEAIHRWYHLKEGYSSKLLSDTLNKLHHDKRNPLRILDPFAGVGTTILSAVLDDKISQTGSYARGIERNPFLHFVGETKLKAVQASNPSEFEKFADLVLKEFKSDHKYSVISPELSTFHNSSYFEDEVLSNLLRLRSSIDRVSGKKLYHDIARLCLASIIEPVSNLRKDGRALRYEPQKAKKPVIEEFSERTAIVTQDLCKVGKQNRDVGISLGDGRNPDLLFQNKQFDLILFSPPYPNNIDYTEVYKLETWFLGFFKTYIDFRKQRLMTLRSHPSVKFPNSHGPSTNGFKKDFDSLIDPVIRFIPPNNYYEQRSRLIRGYFDDMLQVLINAKRLLSDQGRLVYVVANSLHGGKDKNEFLIATDILIANLAEKAGYEVEDFVIARLPTRKSNSHHFLRESIVFLSKAR